MAPSCWMAKTLGLTAETDLNRPSIVPYVTPLAAENSEVPSAPVAVAVIFCPVGTAALKLKLKDALPLAFVVTLL